jgi:Tripartite tricarboxylate transporter family receptor
VTSATRVASASQIPTLAEAGVPGVEVGTWYGMLGPRALPAPVVDVLLKALGETTADPKFIGRLVDLGAELDFRPTHTRPPKAGWVRANNTDDNSTALRLIPALCRRPPGKGEARRSVIASFAVWFVAKRSVP